MFWIIALLLFSLTHGSFLLLPDATWTHANEDCISRGGNLASIHSEDENSQLGSLCRSAEGDQTGCWVGFVSKTVPHQRETFTWSDGSVVDYESWGATRNNSMNPSLVDIDSWTAVRFRNRPGYDDDWFDDKSDSLNAYICDIPQGATGFTPPPETFISEAPSSRNTRRTFNYPTGTPTIRKTDSPTSVLALASPTRRPTEISNSTTPRPTQPTRTPATQNTYPHSGNPVAPSPTRPPLWVTSQTELPTEGSNVLPSGVPTQRSSEVTGGTESEDVQGCEDLVPENAVLPTAGCTDVTEWTTCRFSCQDGYTHTEGSRSFLCLVEDESSFWFPDAQNLLVCEAACPLISPSRTANSCSGVAGNECKFECLNGYVPLKSLSYSCMENGDWDPPFNHGDDVCGLPETVADGFVYIGFETDQEFDRAVHSYESQVPFSIISAQFVVTNTNDSRLISIDLSSVPLNTTRSVELSVGVNTILCVVRNSVTNDETTYTFVIIRAAAETDSSLLSLEISHFNLSFSPQEFQYSLLTNFTTESITVRAVTNSQYATLSELAFNGQLYPFSQNLIPVMVGENHLVVSVHAEDGNVSAYSVALMRSYPQTCAEVIYCTNFELSVNCSAQISDLRYCESLEPQTLEPQTFVEILPRDDSWIDKFDWIVLAIALVYFVFLLILYLVSRHRRSDAIHIKVITTGVSFFDVITDIIFMLTLFKSSSYNIIQWICLIFIVVPTVINMYLVFCVVFGALVRESQIDSWTEGQLSGMALGILFGCLDVDGMSILYSGAFGWDGFSFSHITRETREKIRFYGLFTNVLEDIPQFIIQLMVAMDTNYDSFLSSIVLIALASTLFAILFGVIKRCISRKLFIAQIDQELSRQAACDLQRVRTSSRSTNSPTTVRLSQNKCLTDISDTLSVGGSSATAETKTGVSGNAEVGFLGNGN